MIEYFHTAATRPQSASAFVTVTEKAVRSMDHILGYRRRDRFVIFYYEPRGDEVLWRDSASSGFATGARSAFMEEVAPLADHYNVDVGCKGAPGTHVLLIDRADRRAYFAERKEAVRFLAFAASGQAEPGSGPPDLLGARVPEAMVEITHEAITKMAHEIWERRGRPQGQDLQNWTEAEVRLKAASKALDRSSAHSGG